MHHQTAGIHIKAPTGRGAYIRNVTYRNIHLVNVRQCILVGIGGQKGNITGQTNVSDILFENVRCDVGTTSSYDLSASPTMMRVRFNNVTMQPGVAKQAGCHGLECTCDENTHPCPSCCHQAAAQPEVTAL